MGSRHQPENGADSPDETPEDLRMQDIPRPSLGLIMQQLQAMGVPPAERLHEANKVFLADSMGRAIHALRGARPAPEVFVACGPCVRLVGDDNRTERLPYGYAKDEEGWECDCEDIALAIVGAMDAQQVAEEVKRPNIHVLPPH